MVRLTPDGRRYIAGTTGQTPARPFHYRWLIPAICRDQIRRWQITAWAAAAVYLAGTVAYTGHWAAAPLAAGLTGVIALNVKHPVLVDLPAAAAAVAAAVAAHHNILWLAVLLSVTAGTMKETAPAFAALYAWSPWPLLGLAAPAIRHITTRPGPDVLDAENAWILAHPIRASIKYHRPLPTWVWVLPWGACLAGLTNVDAQLAATLAVAYAQCAYATDTVRLYQWAAPVLIVATVDTIPPAWWPAILAIHLTHPFRTEGV